MRAVSAKPRSTDGSRSSGSSAGLVGRGVWWACWGELATCSSAGRARRVVSARGWCAARWAARGRSAGGGLKVAEGVESVEERGGPWPVGRHPQCRSSGTVDEPAGWCEEPGADAASHDELIVDTHIAQGGGPADEVVSEHCALQPGRVGVEPARGDVVEASAGFEVADGELDGGVLTMEPVPFDDVPVEVGDEGVVPPVRPELLLGASGQPGAAHDQAEGELAGRVGR